MCSIVWHNWLHVVYNIPGHKIPDIFSNIVDDEVRAGGQKRKSKYEYVKTSRLGSDPQFQTSENTSSMARIVIPRFIFNLA
jgi:hypothetical protein